MDGAMRELFVRGGPIMWPLLATSCVALTVVLERLWFLFMQARRRHPGVAEKLLAHVEAGEIQAAISAGYGCPDPIVRTLVHGVRHPRQVSEALVQAANRELAAFTRGLHTLDTVVTLAPLLGLLGTVTGMIRAFGLLGGQELGAPAAITGGIAEALIATAFGLGIAIAAVIPLNLVQSRAEAMRQRLEDAGSGLELRMAKASESHETHVAYR
jgi:biopolymer transport protein ExbB